MSPEIIRLERKIDALTRMMKEHQRPKWVKASAITSITGWNFKKMQQARENGYIDWEKREKGDGCHEYWYDINSLNEKFIK